MKDKELDLAWQIWTLIWRLNDLIWDRYEEQFLKILSNRQYVSVEDDDNDIAIWDEPD